MRLGTRIKERHCCFGLLKQQVAVCPPTRHCIQGQSKWQMADSLGLCSHHVLHVLEETDFPAFCHLLLLGRLPHGYSRCPFRWSPSQCPLSITRLRLKLVSGYGPTSEVNHWPGVKGPGQLTSIKRTSSSHLTPISIPTSSNLLPFLFQRTEETQYLYLHKEIKRFLAGKFPHGKEITKINSSIAFGSS